MALLGPLGAGRVGHTLARERIVTFAYEEICYVANTGSLPQPKEAWELFHQKSGEVTLARPRGAAQHQHWVGLLQACQCTGREENGTLHSFPGSPLHNQRPFTREGRVLLIFVSVNCLLPWQWYSLIQGETYTTV